MLVCLEKTGKLGEYIVDEKERKKSNLSLNVVESSPEDRPMRREVEEDI